MASFNAITIVGYLGRDPELRYTPNGNAVCNFSVATTERRRSVRGEEDLTTWFRVTAWGRQAETCAEYLRKGSQVYVLGRLHIESWTDREGQGRTSVEVTATDIKFLGPRDRAQFEGAGRDDDEEDRPAPARKQAPPEDEDDIPF